MSCFIQINNTFDQSIQGAEEARHHFSTCVSLYKWNSVYNIQFIHFSNLLPTCVSFEKCVGDSSRRWVENETACRKYVSIGWDEEDMQARASSENWSDYLCFWRVLYLQLNRTYEEGNKSNTHLISFEVCLSSWWEDAQEHARAGVGDGDRKAER